MNTSFPTDKETEAWFEENIDAKDCSASSAIYKFRLWLKDREQLQENTAENEMYREALEEIATLTGTANLSSFNQIKEAVKGAMEIAESALTPKQ